MKSHDRIRDHRTDHHAFKIQIDPGKGVDQQIVDDDFPETAGKGIVVIEQKKKSSDKQDLKNDTQDIDRAPPFVPDQRNVGSAKHDRKDDQERERDQHVVLG